ncbi:MarR family transcriptional regulator [Ktedonosporobacter rubrisoli]|uniref:MarR family transcriptional regulator n=1 Tax=Ktedonosporobacter rubrisoli TaxID=2509675 RepID=A0A4P6K0H1_KTERU|nr:MarR family transcriptional regulator [Ktedonosporobacter rubrisoli]QBD80896.1 MarR family transcriptional regulator [Ktedonosporobacter rubrisoli]
MNTVNVSTELSLSSYQALAEFRYQIRRFLHFSDQLARSAGVEPQQHQLLLAVKGLPSDRKATIGELAERLQIQHHSTVELVNRLVEHGLVVRQRDPEDSRQVLVLLTEEGEEVLRRLSIIALSELDHTGPMLARMLSKLVVQEKKQRTS